MFDNLIRILSDFEDSVLPENNPNAIPLPKNANGVILWDQISIDFLLRWSMLNCKKVGHKHTERKEDVTPSGTN